jgi:hypothetical protein
MRIIGYSLPETDVQLRLMLVKTLSENPNTPSLLVVSRPKSDSDKREFESHWRSSMGPELGPLLQFEYRSFEDWVRDG